jgi:hypothetical protein
MRARMVMLALFLAALPAAAAAQGGYGGGPPGQGTRTQRSALPQSRTAVPDIRNPVSLALADSARLGLTAEQLPRLRALSDSLDAQNLPLLRQVQRTMGINDSTGFVMPMTDSVREMRLEVLKTYFQRIRWNNEQAWKQARTVLTGRQAHTATRLRTEPERRPGMARPSGIPGITPPGQD